MLEKVKAWLQSRSPPKTSRRQSEVCSLVLRAPKLLSCTVRHFSDAAQRRKHPQMIRKYYVQGATPSDDGWHGSQAGITSHAGQWGGEQHLAPLLRAPSNGQHMPRVPSSRRISAVSSVSEDVWSDWLTHEAMRTASMPSQSTTHDSTNDHPQKSLLQAQTSLLDL